MTAKIFFIFFLWATTITAYYDIDDSILYKIEFPGHKTSSPVVSEDSGSLGTGAGSENLNVLSSGSGLFDVADEDLDNVVLTSVDSEKYSCALPKVNTDDGSKSSEYTGLSVLGLLEKMFTQQTCAYRLESYWTYELCHGKHLRQYHEERDGKTIKVQEYFLGKFNKEMYDSLVAEYEKDVANGITRHPPTKKIEGLNMPYHEILMTDGTLCDLNQQPRRTRVLYVCYPAGKNEIYSLKEVSTCEYEVVVLTNVLCSHPSYKPEESKEHSISCRPVAQGQSRKPAKLTKMEVDSLKLRSERLLEAHLSGGDKPGQVKIEIRPVQVDIDGIDGEEDLQDTIDRIREGQWKETKREPFKPLMDPQVVKQFLKGEYCLYGGSGWWKYEFCYGKKVDQYHEEGGGKKTVINLGQYKEEDHLSWLENHQSKKPKQGANRKQVSVFYSNGDVCDLTGKPRQIEVKLKCKPADSPSTVSLYLLEPKTCEYVLGVESPLVCDLLPHADPQTGLFPVGLVDSIGQKDSKGTGPKENLAHSLFTKEEIKKLEELKSKIDKDGILDKINKDIFEKAGEVLKDKAEGVSKVTQESVHIIDGVKTTVRKVIVDGMVISTESIQEKDGVKIKHSEVIKEPIEVEDIDEPDVDDGVKIKHSEVIKEPIEVEDIDESDVDDVRIKHSEVIKESIEVEDIDESDVDDDLFEGDDEDSYDIEEDERDEL